ncbi:MAG: hypothetical protein HeimC3_05450 [Candidatus Heimdallarchaeota archaeon LC_3]|nr:MAG: hypothetical protein HeimC3_05450 [Candidatus Heimdallarchaeota archaeon LC_3]
MMRNAHYWKNNQDFEISTDTSKIDIDKLFRYLSYEAYWSKGIPKEIIIESVKHSLNFSMLSPKNEFIGFARVVTDYSTFGWLADVYIDMNHRGKKLGVWLIETIVNHPDLQKLRNFLLFTKDAHALYRKFGWKDLDNPEIILAK